MSMSSRPLTSASIDQSPSRRLQAHAHVSERNVSVLDGSTFVVGDRLGDLQADEVREHGFFSDDTRFISRWVLRVGGAPLELLSLHQDAHFEAQFFLTPTVGPDEQAPFSIMRHRLIDHVWMEEVTVTNHLHQTTRLEVALEVDTDFADLFEVKDGVADAREVGFNHDRASMTLGYRRAEFLRSVTIASSSPAVITRSGFAYTPELTACEQWSASFIISPEA